MTAQDAALYLLAVCGAERLQDAADAVRRYSALIGATGPSASGMPIPSPTWRPITGEFPRLGALPVNHEFIEALVALIESYVEATPPGQVTISIRGPYPWASIAISVQQKTGLKSMSIWYSDDGDEEGPGELALIDTAKARQRRKFVALGGDLNVTATITDTTLVALGAVLRS